MKDAMLKSILGSMINQGLVDKIKVGLMDYVNNQQAEHNAHLILTAQKVEGQEDVCLTVFSKADPTKTVPVKTFYLSELTVEHVKQLIS